MYELRVANGPDTMIERVAMGSNSSSLDFNEGQGPGNIIPDAKLITMQARTLRIDDPIAIIIHRTDYLLRWVKD